MKWTRFAFRNAKRRAQKQNLSFDLSVEYLFTILPDICPIFGVKLVYSTKGVTLPESVSIDRIIPKNGYIKDNVAIISHRANTIKNNSSIEEIEAIINWMQQRK